MRKQDAGNLYVWFDEGEGTRWLLVLRLSLSASLSTLPEISGLVPGVTGELRKEKRLIPKGPRITGMRRIERDNNPGGEFVFIHPHYPRNQRFNSLCHGRTMQGEEASGTNMRGVPVPSARASQISDVPLPAIFLGKAYST